MYTEGVGYKAVRAATAALHSLGQTWARADGRVPNEEEVAKEFETLLQHMVEDEESIAVGCGRLWVICDEDCGEFLGYRLAVEVS